MNWLDRAIQDGVRAGVRKGLKEAFGPSGAATGIIRDTLGVDLPDTVPLNRAQFLFAMAQRFASAGVNTPDACRRYARDTLSEFLKDEKIRFGDAEYGWDRTCAHIVAEEYEISHW